MFFHSMESSVTITTSALSTSVWVLITLSGPYLARRQTMVSTKSLNGIISQSNGTKFPNKQVLQSPHTTKSLLQSSQTVSFMCPQACNSKHQWPLMPQAQLQTTHVSSKNQHSWTQLQETGSLLKSQLNTKLLLWYTEQQEMELQMLISTNLLITKDLSSLLELHKREIHLQDTQL